MVRFRIQRKCIKPPKKRSRKTHAAIRFMKLLEARGFIARPFGQHIYLEHVTLAEHVSAHKKAKKAKEYYPPKKLEMEIQAVLTIASAASDIVSGLTQIASRWDRSEEKIWDWARQMRMKIHSPFFEAACSICS